MTAVRPTLNLPQRLRAAREHAGLSARDAGLKVWPDAAPIPRAAWQIRRYEQLDLEPSAGTVERMAEVYGVCPAWLATGVAHKHWNGCEWDPARDALAYAHDAHHGLNLATWIVGANGNYRLCDSCAALPTFQRYRRRKRIERQFAAVVGEQP